jgi:hypothetical protein
MNARAIGLLSAALYFGASGLLPGLAWGQNPAAHSEAGPVGKVVTITGTVSIEHSAAVVVQANLPPNGVGETKVGAPVYRGDTIQTGPDASLSIIFADGTTFNVSRNARMVVDEFVYDPNSHANSSLVSLTRGTFTFIAGNVAHTGDMKVETPVGTMGIRGTAPRVEISDDGTVKFTSLVEEK